MKRAKLIKTLFIITLCAITLTTSNICTEIVTAQTTQQANVTRNVDVKNTVKPLDIVNSPSTYLNKNVTMLAKFDKFSILGLDYKPSFRSSEEYISFLIKRDDTQYDIPLSEMKLFLKRDIAEKFIDLKTNDEISITGKVFSDALGDAWVDVFELTIIKKAAEKDGV